MRGALAYDERARKRGRGMARAPPPYGLGAGVQGRPRFLVVDRALGLVCKRHGLLRPTNARAKTGPRHGSRTRLAPSS